MLVHHERKCMFASVKIISSPFDSLLENDGKTDHGETASGIASSADTLGRDGSIFLAIWSEEDDDSRESRLEEEEEDEEPSFTTAPSRCCLTC
jgi:hypothetical protein